ncbi:unnamed protein product [Ectocarpus sp. 13 AM-2016]
MCIVAKTTSDETKRQNKAEPGSAPRPKEELSHHGSNLVQLSEPQPFPPLPLLSVSGVPVFPSLAPHHVPAGAVLVGRQRGLADLSAAAGGRSELSAPASAPLLGWLAAADAAAPTRVHAAAAAFVRGRAGAGAGGPVDFARRRGPRQGVKRRRRSLRVVSGGGRHVVLKRVAETG